MKRISRKGTWQAHQPVYTAELGRVASNPCCAVCVQLFEKTSSAISDKIFFNSSLGDAVLSMSHFLQIQKKPPFGDFWGCSANFLLFAIPLLRLAAVFARNLYLRLLLFH